MHELAHIAAATLPGVPEDVLLVPEMPSPLGLPDFMALAGGQKWLQARRAAGVQPFLAEADCSVLAVLHPRQALSLATVARRIGWSLAALEPVLTRLEKAGAVETTPGGAHRVNPALVPRGSVFALEAKVKDWQKAVLQGRAYRTWANNYVVLLGDVGPVAERRAAERVAHDGAGLYSSSGWIVKPRARRPAPAKRLWGFEHLYAATASSGPAL
ncbi:hypothetical protein [Kribbella sp.]|uniref:DprA-like winged helix domain-containing protein n=1 Tax=Kribbella sp. TaxID=1871183 RepID=UPI002D4F0A31|nr:hypothetical protein [Kribbella sp.]HZX06780.1 hypothetical protein [Kribbella sp.]